MRLGIVTVERDEVVNNLIKSCEKFNVNYKIINPANIVAGFNLDFKLKYYKTFLEDLDCCFVRNLGWEGFFRFDVLKYLNEYVTVINPPEGIDRASNKFLTSVFIELNNLPQPKTVVTESINEAVVWIDKLDEVVLKPIFGCEGKGIVRVKKDMPITSKLNILNEFKERYNTFYIQEFIKPIDDEYRDIRAFVIDNEVVAAMYRVGGDNWKNNVAQGGRVESCEITNEIEKLAVKAKNALGLFYAGIDLIESNEGLKILEVNSTPSWMCLSKVSKVNIADKLLEKIIDYIKS